MLKSFDLRQKKVIDVDTAEKIGYIRDMDIDFESGKISSVSIPCGGFFGIFKKAEKTVIPWENIIAIGSEFVIVRARGSDICHGNVN